LIGVLFCLTGLVGQELLSPTDGFSRKKPAYITMNDGTKITGTLNYFKYKKGQIDDIKFMDENGKKIKIPATDIKNMYLRPSGMEKIMKSIDNLTNAETYMDGSLDGALIKDGYVYFETTPIKVKKKEFTALMQLLNPTFSKEIKIYYNQFGSETTSAGIGGITVVGGIEKTYFIAKKNERAYEIKKKDYSDDFKTLWEGCSSLMSRGEKEIKWSDFAKDAFEYSNCEK